MVFYLKIWLQTGGIMCRFCINYKNFFIKKYVKTPLSKFYRILCRKVNCVVFLTLEYRSTILCSTCGHRLLIPKSPHRFASCNACKRDINASRNLSNVGFQMYEAGTVPERFTYLQHVYQR